MCHVINLVCFCCLAMVQLCVRWLVLLFGVQFVLSQLDDLEEDAEKRGNRRSKNKPITSNVIPKNNGTSSQ